MDRIAQFARAQAVAAQIVGSITDDQLLLPTPCSEWTVHDILNHILDGDLLVMAWIHGEIPPKNPRTGQFGADPKSVVLERLAACYHLVTQAGDLKRPVTTRMGSFTVEALAEKRVADLVAHLWDLAVATGQPVDYDPELVESVMAHYHAKLDGSSREGKPVAEPQPVPDGATAADRLAAFLGRSVSAPIAA
ncbi:TIGR03086 family metal-binding protein [Dactylosporangium sp. CA-092794]|uniref:TIGR03086 family metal-binding protein n=1 Tax=Dactylosporangium sp. CA-092794 TaxID=3239929 RepID=UPI003D91B618